MSPRHGTRFSRPSAAPGERFRSTGHQLVMLASLRYDSEKYSVMTRFFRVAAILVSSIGCWCHTGNVTSAWPQRARQPAEACLG